MTRPPKRPVPLSNRNRFPMLEPEPLSEEEIAFAIDYFVAYAALVALVLSLVMLTTPMLVYLIAPR